MYEQARVEAAPKPNLLERLLGRRPSAPPPPSAPLVLSDDEGIHSDLDKAWHGLHFLLTRTAGEGDPPLNFLILGGREVGSVDVGYGPARTFNAAEVRAIQTALAAVSDETLQARFDPAAMMAAGIYPEIWDRPPEEDDTLEYLMEGLGTLRAVVDKAAKAGTGLVVYLC